MEIKGDLGILIGFLIFVCLVFLVGYYIIEYDRVQVGEEIHNYHYDRTDVDWYAVYALQNHTLTDLNNEIKINIIEEKTNNSYGTMTFNYNSTRFPDLIFTDKDGNILEINRTLSHDNIIYLDVPLVESSGTITIYMYYGNKSMEYPVIYDTFSEYENGWYTTQRRCETNGVCIS